MRTGLIRSELGRNLSRRNPLPEEETQAPFRKTALRSGLAIVLIALCLPLWAADAPPVDAVAVAHRVDAYYDNLRSLRADFSESYQGMGIHREEHGTLLLRKPGKMRWDYAKPAGKVFILDSKYGWFYSPGDSEAQRIAASKMNDMRSPLRFLLGHTKIEKELDGLTLARDGDVYRLSGIPKGMNQQVANVTLGVTAQGVIQSMTITETSGALTAFTFTNSQPNAAAPESEFVFHPPAGITVIDGVPPV
jgi:outer membrane lipoprotein carrier protein